MNNTRGRSLRDAIVMECRLLMSSSTRMVRCRRLDFVAHELSCVPAIRKYAKTDKLRRQPNYLTERNGVIATFSINFIGSKDLVLLFIDLSKFASIMDIL